MAEIVVKNIPQTKDDCEQLRHYLTKAMFHSNIARMKLILSKVPEYGCEQQLEAEIASANLLIARLEAQRQSSLKELNEVINKGDITEIKSLAAPPQVVKDVITSAMMLLGYPYKKAWDWQFGQTVLGNSNFLSKLSNVDIDKIPTDVALRVKDNIAGLSEDVCRKINQAIVGCFLWVQNTTNAVLVKAADKTKTDDR